MARVRRHGRISNSLGSRFIFRRRRSWWCAWFLPTPATIRRNDGLEMGPSDQKSPFSLQFWALDPNSYPKIHHSKHHLRLERHRLLFDEPVLGQDARPTPSWLLFFWAAQKTGRSQAEKFRGELSPRPRDTAGRHSCVPWPAQPVGRWCVEDTSLLA